MLKLRAIGILSQACAESFLLRKELLKKQYIEVALKKKGILLKLSDKIVTAST